MPEEKQGPEDEVAEFVRDGLALERIRDSDGFAALERLIKRRYDDLFAAWRGTLGQANDDKSKDYYRGYAEALDGLMPGVDEMISQAQETIEADRSVLHAVMPSDPSGRGDIAV